MNHIGFKFAWKIFNDERIMRALVDADAATDAQAFRDVRLAGVLVHDDAFLAVANGWTKHLTLIVALLRLTIVFLQYSNSHSVTQPILSSFLFCFTCRSPAKNRERQPKLFGSNEALEVLVSTNEADGARGREFHAGLAKGIAGREVVVGIDLDRDNTLTTLHPCGGADVLSKRTSHALRNTVGSGTGGLLVFTQDMVREGVDSESVALCTGLITDG